MSTFIVVAGALTLFAIALVVFPLLKKNASSPTPAIWAAFGAAGVLVFGGGGL